MHKPLTILLSVFLLVQACAGHASPHPISDPGFSYGAAVLPYVEDFVVPETIYEGEPFEAVLILSAQRDPDSLRGVTPLTMYDFSNLPYPPPETGMIIGAWIWRNIYISGDEIVTDVHYPVAIERPGHPNGWPAGTYTVQVISAESREWGGVTDDFEVTPGFELPYSEHQVTREYTITVLPKEPAAQ